LKKSSKNKPYYQNYELVKDPFPVETFDNTLILTPELNTRIDRIKSLINFSDKLVVVTASFGAGKSILADYLESIPEKKWKVCLVQAEIKMVRELLSYEIIQQFTPDRADVPAKSIPQLHKYLEFASKHEIIPVIIIDDAHKLPTATLEFILELAALQYGESRFRFVLFADETITDRLELERLADLTAALVQKVNLPVLSMEQLKEYLDNRLSATGEINMYPFTEKDIEQIFFRSGGVPRSINIVAREIMEEKMTKGLSVPGPIQLVAGIGIISIVIIAVFFGFFQEPGDISDDEIIERYRALVQEQPPPPPLTSTGTLNQEDSVVISQSSNPAIEVFDSVVEVTPESYDTSAELADTEDSISSPQVVETLMQESDITSQASENLAVTSAGEIETQTTSTIIDEPGTIASNLAMAEQSLQESEPQPVMAEDNAIDTFITEPEPATSIAAASPPVRSVTPGSDDNIFKLDVIPGPIRGIRGENWYREQSRNSYALQLISAADIKNVLSLLEGLDEYHDEMSGYVKYTPSGRPRYVLFFGRFPDRESANAAATDSVPDKIKSIKPYPRSIGNIIDEIEEVGYWPR
jgi:type II secretory pathway predicted ATPase ExeA/septal ring-binding cell division protein DamX